MQDGRETKSKPLSDVGGSCRDAFRNEAIRTYHDAEEMALTKIFFKPTTKIDSAVVSR